jgi:hypothetical protein
MSRASQPSIVFEVAMVMRSTVQLEALDIREGVILMGPDNQPASITLPATGILGDVRPGDRFRLIREQDADPTTG